MLDKTLKFLSDLARNNNRPWFNAHKDRYLEAKAEFEAMVEELIPSLQRIDPELGPLTLSECTYRIYRDTRFSPDKTPYKVHMGAYINRQGKKSPFAGYYVHISPVEGSLWGGGLYCPDPRILKAVREDIYENIDEFLAILHDPAFTAHFRLSEHDKLKKAPLGFPSDWPYIDLLKNRHFDVLAPIPEPLLHSPEFIPRTLEAFAALKPLNRFLNFTIEQQLEQGGEFARSITHKA